MREHSSIPRLLKTRHLEHTKYNLSPSVIKSKDSFSSDIILRKQTLYLTWSIIEEDYQDQYKKNNSSFFAASLPHCNKAIYRVDSFNRKI